MPVIKLSDGKLKEYDLKTVPMITVPHAIGAVYSAADIIGKTLIARKSLPLYSNDLKTVLRTITKGETIGVVYSWYGGTGSTPLYWMFINGSGYSYVKHEAGAFDLDVIKNEMSVEGKTDLETAADEAEEARKKAEMGAFAYYVEKYGKVALITAVGIVAFREIMRYQTAKASAR